MRDFFNKKAKSVFIVSIIVLTTACGRPDAESPPSRAGRISMPGQYSGYSIPKYDGAEISSFYLSMHDGVKIAVDLYLPRRLRKGDRIPAILNQTRYVRRADFRWPLSLLKRQESVRSKGQELFASHGYAYVFVDVRGSGASFGVQPYLFSPAEVRDGAEIVDWIVSQTWSDGKVGSFGTSYSGTSAELLLVNMHPAVKAVAPRFALFDAYEEVTFPGGILLDWFIREWGRMTSIMDRNAWREFGLFAAIAVRGVKPVDADMNGSMLAAANIEHLKNNNVYHEVSSIAYRDDLSLSRLGTLDMISPFYYLREIRKSGAAIYSYSGWYDGSYQKAAIHRYLTLRDTNRMKLIVGPWDHGGIQMISPFSPDRKQVFNHIEEMLRFFDYHLKGIKNGIMEEKPVYYYTMGEEKWKWADTWPLPEQRWVTFYLDGGNKISAILPKRGETFDVYRVDYSAGTGAGSRWRSFLNLDPVVDIAYTDRKEQDKKLLCYTGEPLAAEMEITGHPHVRLHVESTERDGNFFVYLEDVDPSGNVTYVTEGQIRAIHRKLSTEKPPYTRMGHHHTYLRKDARPLVPGRPAELVIDLLPISYLFKKGHRIRVALAGADRDNFTLLRSDPPPIWRVLHGGMTASCVVLPVIPRVDPKKI